MRNRLLQATHRAEDRRAAQVLRQVAIAEAISTCPPSATADQIVHCDQVKPGDLMLVAGVLASVEAVEDDASQPAWVRITARHASLRGGGVATIWRERHLLAAVRRYVEG